MKHLTSTEFLAEAQIEEKYLPNLVYEDGFVWGDTSNEDKLRFLMTLVRNKFHDKSILEIGTYRGTTTCNLMTNLSTGTICTVDCGYEELKSLLAEESSEHSKNIRYSAYEVGEVYKKYGRDPERIKQIVGNTINDQVASEIINSGPYDLIYIDAAHTYEGVKSDTELVFQCLAPGSLVIWDDYNGWWTGVNQYLDELARTHDLTYITDNRYVIYTHSDVR